MRFLSAFCILWMALFMIWLKVFGKIEVLLVEIGFFFNKWINIPPKNIDLSRKMNIFVLIFIVSKMIQNADFSLKTRFLRGKIDILLRLKKITNCIYIHCSWVILHKTKADTYNGWLKMHKELCRWGVWRGGARVRGFSKLTKM